MSLAFWDKIRYTGAALSWKPHFLEVSAIEPFIWIVNLIGTVAFAASGALTGLKKGMDLFGVCILGLVTAVGGGVIRDLILGLTPPMAFQDPTSALVALAVSAVFFLGRVRRLLMHKKEILRLYGVVKQQGYSLIPLSLYFKDSRVKVQVGLCRGKKNYDKRAAASARDAKREIDRALKERQRF